MPAFVVLMLLFAGLMVDLPHNYAAQEIALIPRLMISIFTIFN
jgi:hypothetical protein